MKTLAFVILIGFCISANGQGYGEDVEDIPESKKTAEISQDPFIKSGDSGYEYCEILGFEKFLSKKVNVTIDFGQERRFLESTPIKDDKGKIITFNSMVDALNYLGKLGWEFTQAYAITIQNQNVYHWLLKRKRKV